MNLRKVTLRGRALRCLAAAGLVAAAATAGAFLTPSQAMAAESQRNVIEPGASLDSKAGQCTANFLFTNPDKKIFIGAAAHCAGKGGANETDGCKSGSYPLGFPIKIEGATRDGVLAYSSWLAMHDQETNNSDLCQYNDFALIEVDQDDYNRVRSTVPHFGGPNGVRTYGLHNGDKVYTYGNSDLRVGLSLLSPKSGISLGDTGGGWSHSVTTVSPGVPGDSGSGFMDKDGQAFGILSTLSVTPIPGSNGVSDLWKCMQYASHNGHLGAISLINGTSSFRSGSGLGLPLL